MRFVRPVAVASEDGDEGAEGAVDDGMLHRDGGIHRRRRSTSASRNQRPPCATPEVAEIRRAAPARRSERALRGRLGLGRYFGRVVSDPHAGAKE